MPSSSRCCLACKRLSFPALSPPPPPPLQPRQALLFQRVACLALPRPHWPDGALLPAGAADVSHALTPLLSLPPPPLLLLRQNLLGAISHDPDRQALRRGEASSAADPRAGQTPLFPSGARPTAARPGKRRAFVYQAEKETLASRLLSWKEASPLAAADLPGAGEARVARSSRFCPDFGFGQHVLRLRRLRNASGCSGPGGCLCMIAAAPFGARASFGVCMCERLQRLTAI